MPKTPNYTDIISQAMVLNGQIKGKNVSLMHGNNCIDFQKGTNIKSTAKYKALLLLLIQKHLEACMLAK
ncbi:hypothetical protein AB6E88_03175 [Providencia hangzhouensis]